MFRLARGTYLLMSLGIFCGCGFVRITCRKPFAVHTTPISHRCGHLAPRTDGVYFSENGFQALFFYSNGQVLAYARGLGFNYTLYPDSALHLIEKGRPMFTRDNWGCYKQNGDSLAIQHFNYHPEYICNRSVVDMLAIVLDGQHLVVRSTTYHASRESYATNEVYQFHHSSYKPDSSQAWLNHRLWFQKELHVDRK